MPTDDFDVHNLKAGETWKGFLEVTCLPDGNAIRLPLLAMRGNWKGPDASQPVVAVLAGVHGDEFEGILAIREVFSRLDPDAMRGTFVGVPMTNPPAVAASTRKSPIDGLDLARTFPGDPEGTMSQRIAHCVTERIIAPASLLIDLHTAGAKYTMPLYCGYYGGDDAPQTQMSREAALAFAAAGADVLVEHTARPWLTGDKSRCGATVEVATKRGIPCLYSESTGGGWLRSDVVTFYVEGVLNVMRALSVLPEPAIRVKPKRHLAGPRYEVQAVESGLLVSDVSLLDYVQAGDRLGTVLDPVAQTVTEIRTGRAGWVTMMRANPIVYCGEMAYALVAEESSEKGSR
jgi:predicted deacylase